MANVHELEPIRAAKQIIGDFVGLRDRIKATAEGFAVLDFVQGHVATELPLLTARDIVAVMRDNESGGPSRTPMTSPSSGWRITDARTHT